MTPAVHAEAARVYQPHSTEDVQRVLEALPHDAALRIAGSGTWLGGGRPVDAAATLELSQLRGVVEYVPGDLTITVRAGTTLDELQSAAAAHGQWLALDPPGSPRSSLGAVVATAAAGPLAASFGTPRDVLLGVEAVTGDARVVQGGARVVKHVAGFDLVRLMTGAWGTLGILTTLTFRLRAHAPVDATYAVTVDDTQLGAWLAAYRAAPLAPVATELLHGATAVATGAGSGTCVLLRIMGNDASVAAQEAALRSLGAVQALPADVWHRLREDDPADAAVVLRLSRRPVHLDAVWQHGVTLADGVAQARVHATVDRGVVRVVLPALDDAAAHERLESTPPFPCRRIFERLPAALWPRLAPVAVADPVSRRIRAAFDPAARLNRGILGES